MNLHGTQKVELAIASGWNYVIPFLAKGARNETCACISNIDIFTIYGPILTILFLWVPMAITNISKFEWFAYVMLESGYWQFNKCSDLCGTPGT